MFSRIPNTFSSYCGCFPQFGPPLTEFRLQFVSISYLLLSYMANPATDDVLRLSPTRSSTTSIHGPDSHLPPDDPTSASYIPRAARMTPTSTTVHTIFIKKLSYPFSSRPDELWILERTLDGIETWKPVETFLENMHLTRDRAALRTTANHWRQYYDIPIQSSSSSTATSVNPPCSYPVPHSLSCYVWDAIRLALKSSYHDLLRGRTGKWTFGSLSLLIYEILSTR